MKRSRVRLQASRRAALIVTLAIAGFAADATVSSTSVQAEERKTLGADVKIEVKQPSGKVVTHRTQVDEFDMAFTYTFKGDGAEHSVMLNLKKDGDSKKNLLVTLGYDKDGAAIIAPFETTWKANKRDFVKTDDGKYAIALTIKPKMVPLKDKARDDDDQIDGPKSDDPLSGL